MDSPFIFVFIDDNTVDVVALGSNLFGEYEAIDVAEDTYTFFTHELRVLIPQVEPGRIDYELLPGEVQKVRFLEALSKCTLVNPNNWFDDLDSIREFVSKSEF